MRYEKCAGQVPANSKRGNPATHLAQGYRSGRLLSPARPSHWKSSSCQPMWLLRMLVLHPQLCVVRSR